MVFRSVEDELPLDEEAMQQRVEYILRDWKSRATISQFWQFFERFDERDEDRIIHAYRSGNDCILGQLVRRIVEREAAAYIEAQLLDGADDNEVLP